jgi:hypothetical protein
LNGLSLTPVGADSTTAGTRPPLQVNPIQQLSSRTRLPASALCLLSIPRPFPTRVDRIIFTLRKPVLRTAIMGNHCTKDSGAIIGGDRANYDSICSRRFVVGICTGFQDREFEVRLLGVLELKLFVVWDGIRMYASGGDKKGNKIPL